MKTNKYDELVKLANELTNKTERTVALDSLKRAPKEHWESFKLKKIEKENLSSQLNWHAAQHLLSVLNTHQTLAADRDEPKPSRYDELVKEVNETYNDWEAELVMRCLNKIPKGNWDEFKRNPDKILSLDISSFRMGYYQQKLRDVCRYFDWTQLTMKTENVADPKIRHMYRKVLAMIPKEDWEGFEIKRAQWDRISLKRGKSAYERMIDHVSVMTEKNRDKAPDIG